MLAARHIPFSYLPPLCLFHYFTHYPCPTCGMTRSVASIAMLMFPNAWHLNPMGFVFVAMLISLWANSVLESFTGRSTRFASWADRHAVTITFTVLGLFAIFGIVRIWLCAKGFFTFPAG